MRNKATAVMVAAISLIAFSIAIIPVDLNSYADSSDEGLNVTGYNENPDYDRYAVRAIEYYYVGSTGSDDTGDGSESNPFRTINKAYEQSPARAICLIGDYTLESDLVLQNDIVFKKDSNIKFNLNGNTIFSTGFKIILSDGEVKNGVIDFTQDEKYIIAIDGRSGITNNVAVSDIDFKLTKDGSTSPAPYAMNFQGGGNVTVSNCAVVSSEEITVLGCTKGPATFTFNNCNFNNNIVEVKMTMGDKDYNFNNCGKIKLGLVKTISEARLSDFLSSINNTSITKVYLGWTKTQVGSEPVNSAAPGNIDIDMNCDLGDIVIGDGNEPEKMQGWGITVDSGITAKFNIDQRVSLINNGTVLPSGPIITPPTITEPDDELPFIPPQSDSGNGADTTTYVAVAAAAAVVAILAVLAVGISKGKL